MIFQFLELGFVGATTLSLSFLVATWVYGSPWSLGRFIHLGYFIHSWLYLTVFHLRSFAPVPSPEYFFRVIDLIVLTLAAWKMWSYRDQVKLRGLGLRSSGSNRAKSFNSTGDLLLIAVLTVSALVVSVSVYNLRHQHFNTDDVLTLYLPRIDFMLSEGSPLSLSTSTYDSLLNSYPYGPQIMPLRLALIIDSRLALLLDSAVIGLIGAFAINHLSMVLGCSKGMRAFAVALWISSPMVLSQMGAGLTDLHFSAAVFAALAVIGLWGSSPQREPSSLRSEYAIFFILVCLVFSYKLLAFFFLPILGVALLFRVWRDVRLIRFQIAFAFLFIPFALFPVWNSIRMNWVLYGHPLGNPGVFELFSESASFSERISFLRENMEQLVPDLLGGNTVLSGGFLHRLLDGFAVWGAGVRVSEGVIGPGFVVTLMAFASAGAVGLVAIWQVVAFFGRKAGFRRTVLTRVQISTRRKSLSLAALASASIVTFLGIVYQRQVYSIATIRYLLAALLVLAVLGLVTFGSLSTKTVRRSVAVLIGSLLIVQVAIDIPIMDQLKRSAWSSKSDLADPRAALTAASGFMYLGDHVLLLDAFLVCVDSKSSLDILSTSRDKFPHGFYSAAGSSYTLSPVSEIRDWSMYEVAVGDQLGQQPQSEDRYLVTFGFQWLSVAKEYWRC